MLNKFKSFLNKGGVEKDSAQAVPAQEQEQNVQSPAEPVDVEEQTDKILFDEMLGAPQYTYEEFLEVLNSPQEERGETDEVKKHWGYPRRWKVILWDLQIQNYMNNTFSAFVDFDFGGNREECRIQVAR